MRKLLMVLTLAISFFAVGGSMIAGDVPPGCDVCPWVR
jgi:hypothetical protein